MANEPGVDIIAPERSYRVSAQPSSIDTELFRSIEATQRKIYPGTITIPTMTIGATDKVYLQAKGMTTYGFGPVVDEEDGDKGFGAHSDQERLRETELYRFMQFHWEVILRIAAAGRPVPAP